MSQHFIEKCVCGIVIRQCRCPGGTVKIIEPCIHQKDDDR